MDTHSLSQSAPPVQNAQKENWITLNMMDKGLYAAYLSGASIVSSLMSHPFFVITTQNQVGKHISKDAGSGGARLVIAAKAIGLRGLFHGAIVSQIFQTPNSVVYLWSLEQSRESTRAFLSAYYPSLSTGTVDAIQVTCSAGVSNFLSMIISYPANLVITKMVIQEKNNRLGFINTIKEIYKTHGKHGFSHGFAANFAYNASFSMGWWYAYGNSRRLCVQLIPEIEKDEIYVDGLSGFFAGIFATLLSHPLDSVSARIMTGTSKHLTLAAATREIIHSEGPMVLWRGLFPSMMGTLVSSTIFALAYEYIKRAASLE